MVSVVNSGSWAGIIGPKAISTTYKLPPGYCAPSTAIWSVSANRIFYFPFALPRTISFSGAYVYEIDNEAPSNLRIGIYRDDAVSGGPGSLLGDFGAVAPIGSTGMHGAVSTILATGPAMYWGAVVCDSASQELNSMSALGGAPTTGLTMPPFTELGSFAAYNSSSPASNIYANTVVGYSVSSAYGAFPATAVTPTTDIFQSAVNLLPAVYFKVT